MHFMYYMHLYMWMQIKRATGVFVFDDTVY
jgi:hypothetical protein